MEKSSASRGERPRYVSLATATSRDGLLTEFYRIENQSVHPVDGINFSVVGSGLVVSIPILAIEFAGDGDLEHGMVVLAARVKELEFTGHECGDVNPLFRDVIYPMYGGMDNYVAAMNQANRRAE